MADEVVGSKLPANNGYGQNGFPGPSSDQPGQHTTSGFLPATTEADLSAALDRVNPKDRDMVRNASGKGNPPAPKDFKQPKFAAPQTREVSGESYPLSFGMDQRSNRKA